MYTAIIIHAPIRGGKTETCRNIVKRCIEAGIAVGGITSPCRIIGDETVGYDCIEYPSEEVFPLVKLGAPDDDWFQYGSLKYLFSKSGFERANEILYSCINDFSLVIIDEFGRVERNKDGFYGGFQYVAQNMKNGVYIIACRGDLIDTVKENLPEYVQTYVFEASEHEKIWAHITSLLM